MGGRTLIVVLSGVVLAACTQKPKPPVALPLPPPVVVLPPPVAEDPIPFPLLKPTPPALPALPKALKPPPPTPDELIGLDEAGVEQLLGTTPDIRNEGVARIMSYRVGHCAVDVVFFMDLKAGGLRVASYQLVDDPPTHAGTSGTCYPTIRITK